MPDKLTGLFLLGMDWRLAFADYPALHPDATIGNLFQAWTLGAELTFYLMAPWLLRSWKLAAALLLASAAVRAVLVWRLGFDVTWTYIFLGSTLCFFLAGHVACRAAERWPAIAGPRAGMALMTISLATMVWRDNALFDDPAFWFAAACFAAALPGFFEASRRIRWMNLAGDPSYPVYLVHFLVAVVFGDFAGATLPAFVPADVASWVSVTAYLAATTAAAAAVHWLIEKPAASVLRCLVRADRAKAIAAGSATP